MKYLAALSGLFLLFTLTTASAEDETQPGPRQSLNSIVAVVNDVIILSSELENATRSVVKQLEQ